MQLLSIGYPQTLTKDVIYALPAKRCLLFCDTGGVALEQSTNDAMTVDVNMVLTDGMEQIAGGFIRATNVGGAVITLMPYVH